jgi:hypothetical protein
MKPLILSLVLLLAGCYPVSVVSTPEPNIYITRTDRIRTMDGDELHIMEYAIDGKIQSAVFNSQEAMTRYWEYLHTIGKVYQREEE